MSVSTRSTGFILEGFPHHLAEVQYMLQQQLIPDLVVIMEVDAFDVSLRLLPTYLENWRERRNRREAQQTLLRDLRKKNLVSELVESFFCQRYCLGMTVCLLFRRYRRRALPRDELSSWQSKAVRQQQ